MIELPVIENKPMAGRAVYFPAVLPAGLLFSIMPGVALVGVFVFRDGAEWLGAGLIAFGAMGFVVFFVVLACEFTSQSSLLTEHIAREQAMTARLIPQAAIQPPAPLTVETTTYKPEGRFSKQIRHYDNPPPKDFVEWVIETAWGEGTRGRRVPERIAAEAAKQNPTWGASYNQWLGMLEEQSVLQREHGAENAPRRWADNVTPNEALARFGYADPKFIQPHPPVAMDVPEFA